MKDCLIKFCNLKSLFAFFYSANFVDSEILSVKIKVVNNEYWLLSSNLPDRLKEITEDDLNRLLSIYPDSSGWENFNSELFAFYNLGSDYHPENAVFFIKNDVTHYKKIHLSEQEFILAIRNREMLQKMVSFFFTLNHTKLEFLALQNDSAMPFEYLLLVRDFEGGIPIKLTSGIITDRSWEIFYKINNAPEHEMWFADQMYGEEKLLPISLFLSEQNYYSNVLSEPLFIINKHFYFRFNHIHFAPILDFVKLDIKDASRPLMVEAPFIPGELEIKMNLRKKMKGVWQLSERLHHLDKKSEELQSHLKMIDQIKRKLGGRHQWLSRHGYLYCYRRDEDNFRRILQERPLSDKEGLYYYKSDIVGLGDELHVLTSKNLLEEDFQSDSWNITIEYLPDEYSQQYYLQPEWFIAGIFIFIPLEYELIPYVDITKQEQEIQLVRTLLPEKWSIRGNSEYKEDVEIQSYIRKYIFILTPNAKTNNGEIFTTIIGKNRFQPLVNSYKLINENIVLSYCITSQSLEDLKAEGVPDEVIHNLASLESRKFQGQRKFIDVLQRKIGDERTLEFKPLILKHTLLHDEREILDISWKWWDEEIDDQISKKLKEDFNEIQAKEHEVICEDQYYQKELSELRAVLKNNLDKGDVLKNAIAMNLKEYRLISRLCKNLNKWFKKTAFTEMHKIIQEYALFIQNLQQLIFNLKKTIDSQINTKLKFEIKLENKLNNCQAQTEAMNKELFNLAKRLDEI